MMIVPSSPRCIEDPLAGLPRWYRWLVRGRFILAGVYLLSIVILAGLTIYSGLLSESSRWGVVMIPLVFFGIQAALLAGAPHFRWPKPVRRRWMMVSLVIGAMLAGLLTLAFVGTLCSFLHTDLKWIEVIVPQFENVQSGWLTLLIILGVPWGFWFILFTIVWAGEWLPRFQRMYRLLLAGTWLELLVTIPVDVSVQRRTKCYCEEGTFYSMVIGLTMVFWTFGPGVVLLFFNIHGRRAHPGHFCRHCGYDLRGLPEARCPECGTPFTPLADTAAGVESDQSRTHAG